MSKTAASKVERLTINSLMDDLEMEIASVKNGELSEAKARIVAKNRGLQLKAVELILQAARIETRFRPALGQRLGLPDLVTVVEAKK